MMSKIVCACNGKSFSAVGRVTSSFNSTAPCPLHILTFVYYTSCGKGASPQPFIHEIANDYHPGLACNEWQ